MLLLSVRIVAWCSVPKLGMYVYAAHQPEHKHKERLRTNIIQMIVTIYASKSLYHLTLDRSSSSSSSSEK